MSAKTMERPTKSKMSDEEYNERVHALIEEFMARSAKRTPDPRDRKLIPARESFRGLL